MATLTTRLALAFAAAGCLGEPPRPHGIGPPIAEGSVLRHATVVGDVNGDGYDDLAIWGNEGAPGQNPTLFVYFGGEILQNPDLRADLTIDIGEMIVWREAVAGSIYVSADGTVRGIPMLVGQDDELPTAPAYTRFLSAAFYPIVGRQFGERQITTEAFGRNVGGYAPEESNAFALERDTVASLPARQLLIGSPPNSWAYAAPLSASSQNSDMDVSLPEPNALFADMVELPANGNSEDMLVLSWDHAYRTRGDAVPMFATGVAAPLVSYRPTMIRGRARGDHFFAVARDPIANQATIIDVAGATDPQTFKLTTGSLLDDAGIADVGGDDRIDVVALESGTLGVHRDITLDGPTVTATEAFGSRDALVDYDLLAVGNFHGDARLEIYVLSALKPWQDPLCYRMVGPHDLARCDGE
jgi:hypothetical protein